MVSAKLRDTDMGMEKGERKRRIGGELHKMNNRCRPQNARLYNQEEITEREDKGKSRGKSFKVRKNG